MFSVKNDTTVSGLYRGGIGGDRGFTSAKQYETAAAD
jgi:hypothetical protein